MRTKSELCSTREHHYDALCTKIDMRLTPKLISKCTTNFNFSANHGDNENDQDNENHLYFTPCSNVFNVDFNYVIVH